MDIRIRSVRYEAASEIPEKLKPGVVYHSENCRVAIHSCACGCGEETVTPLDPERGWQLVLSNGRVSLYPSIGNYQMPCASHYIIREGQVDWL